MKSTTLKRLAKQAEKNHSYNLAAYLCWLDGQNASLFESRGEVHLSIGEGADQDFFEICRVSDVPASWQRLIEREPKDPLTDDERVDLLTTIPRYIWEGAERSLNREGVKLCDHAEADDRCWDEDTWEDGFITSIYSGIYYKGKKILTDTNENEFRNGMNGTWFQEVK